jgi:hypothetical protein
VVVLAGSAVAQSLTHRGKALLNEPRLISGIVLDGDGHGIAKAVISYTEIKRFLETDDLGRFDLKTAAPAFVIRKPGYQSKYVRTVNDRDMRVVLLPTAPLPLCSKLGSCGSDGGGAFCFPAVSGIRVSKPSRHVEYQSEKFVTNGKSLLHGWGANWSSGVSYERVWNSIDYREESFLQNGPLNIVDSRGKSPQGRYWRHLGMARESASYDDVDEFTAAMLDKVLDGVCLLPLKK